MFITIDIRSTITLKAEHVYVGTQTHAHKQTLFYITPASGTRKSKKLIFFPKLKPCSLI